MFGTAARYHRLTIIRSHDNAHLYNSTLKTRAFCKNLGFGRAFSSYRPAWAMAVHKFSKILPAFFLREFCGRVLFELGMAVRPYFSLDSLGFRRDYEPRWVRSSICALILNFVARPLLGEETLSRHPADFELQRALPFRKRE